MIIFLRLLRDLVIKLIDWFYKPFQNIISPVTFRYAFTGGINTSLDILLYFIFYNFIIQKQNVDLEIFVVSPHIAAFIFVFPITFTSGFLLAKYITFSHSSLKGRIQLFRYGVSVGGSIIFNYLLLKLFVETFGWYATIAKIITTVIVIIYSYIIQKYFTFRIEKTVAFGKDN